jgi:tetratricopeptide (TPR) repeat protein
MRHLKYYALATIILAFLFTGSTEVQAQAYPDVVNKFNEAQEVLRGNDLPKALAMFKETAQMARSVGSEASELRERAERQIPNIQFTIARENLNARRFDQAITGFNQALAYAEQYKETNISNNVRRALPVVYLQYGNAEFRNGNDTKATELYKKAVELNSNYGRAYYQLGLVERRKNNVDAAIAYYDQAIQIARATNDREVENLAESAARDYLTFLGATEVENGRYRQGLALLERSLEYDMEHADTYYRLAEAQNNLSLWDEAIRSAEQALRFERGGQVVRAKIHFELGIAHMGKNNVRQACASFRSAAYGQFRAPAEHHMEHDLKCN